MQLQPALHEFNLASHLVWWVAGGMGIVLGGIALAEAWDWLRSRWSSLRATPEAD